MVLLQLPCHPHGVPKPRRPPDRAIPRAELHPHPLVQDGPLMARRDAEQPRRRSSWTGAAVEERPALLGRLRRLLPERSETPAGPTLAERRDTERRIASGEIPVQRPDPAGERAAD